MALPGEADHHENCLECGAPMKLQVLHSNAGYYLGTFCNTDGPHTRESEYFTTVEEATAAFEQWQQGNKIGARTTAYRGGHVEIIHPNPILNPPAVEAILQDCYLPEGREPVKRAYYVDGIVNAFALDPDKVESHVEEIKQMLDELPDEFRADSEHEGWTFLNMCVDKHGNQWTGLHMVQEQLMVLGLASGWLHYVLPRQFWQVFRGGMPYVVIGNTRVMRKLAGPEDLDIINQARKEQKHDHA